MSFTPIVTRIEYGGAIIGQEEKDAINAVIDSQGGKRWTIGPESEAFERELAETVGVRGSVVVNSGSSALLVATTALKLPKGSKVIIPALNFPTAYSSLLQNNLIPVVVDCDLETLNISFEEVERAIGIHPDIKAVVAIHIAGNQVNLERLREIVGDRIIISDNCIAEGTLIKTNIGDKPIESIVVGDMVLTRNGYRKVTKTWDKGYQEVITRLGVTATPDHKFITKSGKKELQTLKPSDILYQWNEKSLSIEEKNISDILKQTNATEESTFGMVQPLTIGNFILTTLEKLKKDISFTIKTITHLITNYPIYKVLLQNNTQAYTSQKREGLILHKATSLKQEMEQYYGISQQRGKSFMQNIINGFGLSEKRSRKFVQSVKNPMKHIINAQSTVQQNVKKVYDLSVEKDHEFFANNVLVSNCDGLGGTVNGKFIDTYADVSCVSFHAAHIITMGEGGAVLSNDEELLKRARKIREWGRASGSDAITKHEGFPPDYRERYVFDEIGYNLKPLELQCAMGRIQLKKLQKFKEARRENFKRLFNIFLKHNQFQTIQGFGDCCWFSFPIICKTIPRAKVMAYFEAMNVETRTIFSGNILNHPAYKNEPHIKIGDLENSEYIMKNGMFLSCHPSLDEDKLNFIEKCVNTITKW